METQGKCICFKRIFLFKSYYVVWKLIIITHTKKSTHGLNRTMQYGNTKI